MDSHSAAQRALASVPTGLWIGGRAVDAENAATFPVHDPATGESIAHVADASPADAIAALDAAVAAQPD
jgi:succinate-semialdehyde dehydrogenase / glutarate-semialdehyde dehydrogenase